MKRCPVCEKNYSDLAMKFCRLDGAMLVERDDAATEILPARSAPWSEPTTRSETTQLDPVKELIPETRYAKSGDIKIAYQVLGDGPIDLIYVPGWVTNLEYGWEEPTVANFYR